jgi:alanyl-tRNA synthetase
MQSAEIRRRFIDFFVKRGHIEIPSASLIPAEVSATQKTLFNSAGMQPLIPYLLGKEHPKGKRLVDIQKCIRTGDIDDVGDNRHLTFFEMLGNWSLGDYFKEDAIKWSYELLTSKDEGFGLDPNRLYITCFEGDENASKDTESAEIWMNNGIKENKIYFLGAEDNWWSAGEDGPCGPDTEMFYDLTENGLGDLSKEDFLKAVKEETVVEIWNDVFMQYEKKAGKVIGKLATRSVDTGAGLERITAVMQGKKTAYDTDIFELIFSEINSQINEKKNLNPADEIKYKRILADHLRAAVFMIADGVLPSNTDQGYVLRRLLRRAVLNADRLNVVSQELGYLATQGVVNSYVSAYPELGVKRTIIHDTIMEEENKFRETLKSGLKEFEKGTDAFTLFTSYGFPFELTKELAKEKGIQIDEADFNEKFKSHQDLSRAGAEQKFKGGLAGHSDIEVKYHTATHLLHQALKDVLGNGVEQKGSNITPERLRFDFSHTAKVTGDELRRVEELVNQKIIEALPVQNIILPKIDALKTGARHLFSEKYGDEVSIYFIGHDLDTAYSKEFCGGPHVKNTSELGHFKIQKEEAVAQGVRRIKAVLE